MVLTALAEEACQVGRPLQVFDAGCGTGGLLVQLGQQSWVERIGGCEPHPIALQYCQHRNILVRSCGIETLLDVENPGGFDVVLCMDVLVHGNIDPDRASAVLATLLKPGGILLINTAAMPSLRRDHDRRVHGVRRFIRQDLHALIESKGMHVEKLSYWNALLMPLLWLKSRLESILCQQLFSGSELEYPGDVLNGLFTVLLRLEHGLAQWVCLPFGSSLFLQARKPQ